MSKILSLAVGGAIAGFVIYQISTGRLHSAEGKFLGVIPEAEGFGLDDVAKGAVVLGAAMVAGKLVSRFGIPAPKVSAA
jgi:hypothetical protein